MFCGLFKSKKDNDLKELTDKVNKLDKLFNIFEQNFDLNINYYRDLRGDFEKFKGQIEGYKEKQKKVFPEKRISPATAILNILKNSKEPLDFNSIKDKIKEYNLKSIDVSDKQIRQSIYNLIYVKKVGHGNKRGTYQIHANAKEG